jgi:hypothetical protein
MTNTQTLLEAAIQEVEGTLAHHQAIYTNGIALSSRAETARIEFMNRIRGTSGDGSPLNLQKGWPEIENILGSESVSRYLVASAVATAVQASPAFQEADAIITPLIADVRRLEALIEAEQTAYGQKLAAIRDAEEAAISKAQAALEADPAVKKLREQAEAARPSHIEPPPFRGKVALATA